MAEARRMGGRAARQRVRAAPIPEENRPVQPGMEAGRYKPLADADAERIHRAVVARRRVLIPGVANRISAALGHVLPRVTEGILARSLLAKLD